MLVIGGMGVAGVAWGREIRGVAGGWADSFKAGTCPNKGVLAALLDDCGGGGTGDGAAEVSSWRLGPGPWEGRNGPPCSRTFDKAILASTGLASGFA